MVITIQPKTKHTDWHPGKRGTRHRATEGQAHSAERKRRKQAERQQAELQEAEKLGISVVELRAKKWQEYEEASSSRREKPQRTWEEPRITRSNWGSGWLNY